MQSVTFKWICSHLKEIYKTLKVFDSTQTITHTLPSNGVFGPASTHIAYRTYSCMKWTRIWSTAPLSCFLYSLAVFIAFISTYADSFCQAQDVPRAFSTIRGDMSGLAGRLWPSAGAQRWLTGGGEMSRQKHALHFLRSAFPQATLISSEAKPVLLMAVFSNSKQRSFLLRSDMEERHNVHGLLPSRSASLWHFMVWHKK